MGSHTCAFLNAQGAQVCKANLMSLTKVIVGKRTNLKNKLCAGLEAHANDTLSPPCLVDKNAVHCKTLKNDEFFRVFVIRKPRDSRGVQRRLKPMRMTKELRLCKIRVDLPVNEKTHNRRTLECESKITSRIV